MMNEILGDFIGKFVEVYVDDIIIYSEDNEDHIMHLTRVLEALNKVNLKLSLEKSKFFQKEVKFLGHLVSEEGIKPDPKKVEAVRDFPVPINLKELRGFLGLASYYRKFIEKFSSLAKPLNLLLKKDAKYNWSKECQKAFETLKMKLMSAPVLRHPDFSKPFFISTDASGTGLGAVLAQKDEKNREYVIEYASKGLQKAQENYSAQELECLAVIWAIEHFYPYVGISKFYLLTDNSAMTWLHTSELKGRRGRWISKLQPYNFEIKHRSGKKNTNADALSRIPINGY